MLGKMSPPTTENDALFEPSVVTSKGLVPFWVCQFFENPLESDEKFGFNIIPQRSTSEYLSAM